MIYDLKLADPSNALRTGLVFRERGREFNARVAGDANGARGEKEDVES